MNKPRTIVVNLNPDVLPAEIKAAIDELCDVFEEAERDPHEVTPLVAEIWKSAAKAAVTEFAARMIEEGAGFNIEWHEGSPPQ